MATKTAEEKAAEKAAADAADVNAANVEAGESRVVGSGPVPESDFSDAEVASILEEFHAGNLRKGVGLRFVTRGGETVPVARKLGK